jgi:hypothetical protein
MRNLLATTAAPLLALCVVSSAPQMAAADTALGTSAWSLEIGTDVGTGDNDVSFAIRRHSGESSAFRFGIEVNMEEFDGDGTRTTTGSPDQDVEQNSDGSLYALSIQWMHFAPIRNNVSATFAVGPVVQMQRQSFRQGTAVGLPAYNSFEFSQKSTTFGLDLGLGVEWFFNRRVSLGGQTGLRAVTGSSDQVTITRSGTGLTYSKTEVDIDSDVMEITTGTGRIQLTAYF